MIWRMPGTTLKMTELPSTRRQKDVRRHKWDCFLTRLEDSQKAKAEKAKMAHWASCTSRKLSPTGTLGVPGGAADQQRQDARGQEEPQRQVSAGACDAQIAAEHPVQQPDCGQNRNQQANCVQAYISAGVKLDRREQGRELPGPAGSGGAAPR